MQNFKSLCAIVIGKWTFKKLLSKNKNLSHHFDIPFILACNSKSLIPFNSSQSQLLFDAGLLCFKIDQVVMELSTKTLTLG